MDLFSMLKNFKGMNPRDIIFNRFVNSNTNPFIANLINLGEKGDYAQIDKIARNICKEKRSKF